MMGYNSETSNQGVPMGGSFALNGGSTVFCCSAGAYVPVEQAITDPLRRRRVDDLLRGVQDVGHMSLIREENVTLRAPERRRHFESDEKELAFLTAEQEYDMKTCSCCPPKKIS
jgi:hypothetical protein